MSTYVTQITLDSGTSGYTTAEITVVRGARPIDAPNPEDLPEDIRHAVKVWLAGNQP